MRSSIASVSTSAKGEQTVFIISFDFLIANKVERVRKYVSAQKGIILQLI